MKILIVTFVSMISLSAFAANPNVIIKTSKGDIEVELFEDKAPNTVKNFLSYVKKGHYNGTFFHRVINGFMIQGGGYDKNDKDLKKEKPTDKPIENEAREDVKNLTGTLAMARTTDIHSATAQFFINVADNAFLDHRDKTVLGYGYAVFGKVTKGMDVVNKIKGVNTGRVRGVYDDVPTEQIVILDITQKK